MHSLRELSDQVEGWVRARLWAQVVVGLVLGIVVGYLIGPDTDLVSREASDVIASWLALPGNVFLGLISMVLVPLVIGSIIQGLNGSQSGDELRSLGSRFLVYVVVTTVLAAALGITLAERFQPGQYMQLEGPSDTPAPVQIETTERNDINIPDALVGMLPVNPSVAVGERDMLAIVVLALIFGLACRAGSRGAVGVILALNDAVLEVAMRVIKWAMFLTPAAVFGLMAQLIANVGIGTLVGMTAYVLTVITGLLGLLAVYLTLVALLGRRNPWTFFNNISSPVLVAFSTSSSSAVMPLSIETAVNKLRVPESVARLVIPLGATVNMAGTALYQSVAIIFMAQVSGIDLTTTDQLVIVVTLVASSIGAPGTPGVGIVILGSVAADMGIPATALPLVLGVDRILDMCRTAVNLTGDMTACVLLGARTAGK